VVIVVAVAATVVPLAPAGGEAIAPRVVARVCPGFESSIDGVPVVANPFDPAEVHVDVSFVGPDGSSQVVDAFFFHDYTRSLDADGDEVRVPVGDGGWRVRFTPPASGTWRWTPRVLLADGTALDLGTRTFTCEADRTGHGFVRRSPADPHQLVFDDGTPFVAVGENLAWYGRGGTYDYDRWIGDLAAHHATWIRVWMPSWSMGLEWLQRDGSGAIIENSLGNYTTRLDRAWQLDRVIEAARRHGIVVQLVLSNPEWGDNPYNAANGGPLATPADMFTDPTARALFKRRLRYIVARWGYAPNLIWELWNEVDLSGGDVASIVAWHEEMAGFLAATDTARHLRTTSTFAHWDFTRPTPRYDALWALPELDVVQLHVYAMGTDHAVNFTTLLPRVVPLVADRYGKPVLVGEAGVDWRGPDQTNLADPTGQGLHEMVWSGVFSGSVGSAMTWWWDTVIEPKDQYPSFDGLVALLDGIAFDREQFEPTSATFTSTTGVAVQALTLRGTTTTLVWVRNPTDWWRNPDPSRVEGASIPALPAGEWDLTWYDPYTGAASGAVTVHVNGGDPAPLAVPPFHGEIALRAERRDATPPTSTTVPSMTTVHTRVVAPIDRPMPAAAVVAMPTFTG
jgi:hypothetical protein